MPPRLVRSMGRWTLAALMINSVIGSGIFGLPANVDGLVGTAAPVAYVGAAAGIALIMASFAEVGSQFRESGGIYLYARHAFGRLAGIQMGWMPLMVRVSAHAAIANLLVVPLAEFVPGMVATVPRAVVIVGVLGGLACINVLGMSASRSERQVRSQTRADRRADERTAPAETAVPRGMPNCAEPSARRRHVSCFTKGLRTPPPEA